MTERSFNWLRRGAASAHIVVMLVAAGVVIIGLSIAVIALSLNRHDSSHTSGDAIDGDSRSTSATESSDADADLDQQRSERSKHSLTLQLARSPRYFDHHSNEVSAVAISSDGQFMATAGLDGLVAVWNLQRGVLQYDHEMHECAVTSIVFVNGDAELISGDENGRIVRLDLESGEAHEPERRHSSKIHTIVAAADQSVFASSGDDYLIKVSSAAAKRPDLPALRSSSGAYIAMDMDLESRRLVAVTADGALLIASIVDGQTILRATIFEGIDDDHVIALAFGPEAGTLTVLTTAGYRMTIDEDDGTLIEESNLEFAPLRVAAFDSTAHTAVASKRDGGVMAWDVQDALAFNMSALRQSSLVTAITFDVSRGVLAIGYSDGAVRVWAIQ